MPQQPLIVIHKLKINTIVGQSHGSVDDASLQRRRAGRSSPPGSATSRALRRLLVVLAVTVRSLLPLGGWSYRADKTTSPQPVGGPPGCSPT